MKLRLALVLCALLVAATFAAAQEAEPSVPPATPAPAPSSIQTVLMPDGTVYAIDALKSGAQLELSRRRGDERETLVVPTTGDDAIESQARLDYDATNNTVYLLWHRAAEEVDEVRLASLNAAEEWSEVLTVSRGAEVHRAGLHMVLTHSRGTGDDFDTTLVHVAWWSIGVEVIPEYALLAFEKSQHVSTELIDLTTFKTPAALAKGDGSVVEAEEADAAIHPPLFLARNGNEVDVVFGAPQTTALTHVRIQPRRISSEARIWRPSGRSIAQTPPSRLTSLSTAPVETFLKGDRLVLYTPDAKFRYSIFDNGEWTPVRMIGLDEDVTSDHLLRELHRTVEESTTIEPQDE